MILLTKCSNCQEQLSIALPDDTNETTAEIVSKSILCEGCRKPRPANQSQPQRIPRAMAGGVVGVGEGGACPTSGNPTL